MGLKALMHLIGSSFCYFRCVGEQALKITCIYHTHWNITCVKYRGVSVLAQFLYHLPNIHSMSLGAWNHTNAKTASNHAHPVQKQRTCNPYMCIWMHAHWICAVWGADKALSAFFLWHPLWSRPAVRELVLPEGKFPFVGACGREALNPL